MAGPEDVMVLGEGKVWGAELDEPDDEDRGELEDDERLEVEWLAVLEIGDGPPFPSSLESAGSLVYCSTSSGQLSAKNSKLDAARELLEDSK
ncbi:unnamed protein product [Linum trigynum]|uniref:Uncharacterized protein n=1 Tax=Linum trigynum TaxID=586398 RepID=A0AAV2DWC7_9ROSI